MGQYGLTLTTVVQASPWSCTGPIKELWPPSGKTTSLHQPFHAKDCGNPGSTWSRLAHKENIDFSKGFKNENLFSFDCSGAVDMLFCQGLALVSPVLWTTQAVLYMPINRSIVGQRERGSLNSVQWVFNTVP